VCNLLLLLLLLLVRLVLLLLLLVRLLLLLLMLLLLLGFRLGLLRVRLVCSSRPTDFQWPIRAEFDNACAYFAERC
jgi:hypothetical protein